MLPARDSFLKSLPLWLAVLALSLTVAGAGAAISSPNLPPPGPVAGDIEPILATKALRKGTQRVAFLLAGDKALIKTPEATVTSVYLEGDGGAGETRQAEFHLWPYGVRGAYSAEMTFDRPGRWRLDIAVADPATSGQAGVVIDVAERVAAPEIGTIAPRSRTKTLETVGSLEQLTTDYSPDPDLYRLSVDEAVASGKPSVLVFATPAFCTSATCGPQVDTVSELKELHRGEANFIHIELYDNPDEIQGNLNNARLAPVVSEWGFDKIPDWFNESWTFVLDADGRILQRFEGFSTLAELEEALQEALAPG